MTNVILITIDCLRADHLGCMGYHRNTSPFLDKLAKKGLFFKNAFSNGPNTRHSVPSFLSSTYPLLFNDEALGKGFHKGRKSIAEVLKNHGYTTGGIHSNPYVSKFYKYDRGFDYFNDFLIGRVEEDIKRKTLTKKYHELMKGVRALFFHQLPHETGKNINKETFQWLEQIREPFFLWIHYMDVHMPFVPPNRHLKKINVKTYSHYKKIWMGKKINDIKSRDKISESQLKDYINLYDGSIRYTDEIIETLINKIEKNYPETIFIITSDHGEEFREHGDLSHIEKLYDELLHIPLIFYGKNIKNKIVEKPISLLDLAPTLLSFLGIKEKKSFQGKNFLDSEDYIIAEALGKKRITAYRDKEWKLISDGNKKELYNLREDPKEKNNIFTNEEKKEIIKKLEQKILDHIKNNQEEQKKRQELIRKEKLTKSIMRVKQENVKK